MALPQPGWLFVILFWSSALKRICSVQYTPGYPELRGLTPVQPGSINLESGGSGSLTPSLPTVFSSSAPQDWAQISAALQLTRWAALSVHTRTRWH